jgi:uncharacterized protein YjbJ (UPF0337 family)
MELNIDILAGKWKQIRGKIKEEWGELTDDDLGQIGGQYDQLVGALQERYGHSREEAEQEVDKFLKSL